MRKIKYKIKNDDMFKELRSELFRKGEDLSNFDSIKEVDTGLYRVIKRDEQGRKTQGYIDIFQDIRGQGYKIKTKMKDTLVQTEHGKYEVKKKAVYTITGKNKEGLTIGQYLDKLHAGEVEIGHYAKLFGKGISLVDYEKYFGNDKTKEIIGNKMYVNKTAEKKKSDYSNN